MSRRLAALPASLAAGGLPSCVLPVAQRQSASACVDEFYQRNPLQLSRYEHTPSQPPGILEFNPPRGANGSLPPAGLPVSLTSTVESVAVNQVPPFNQQPSFEITKISPGNGCEVNHASPEEVEAELRLYASQQIPEAANPSYSFESSYEYFDTHPVAVAGTCGAGGFNNQAVPACIRRLSIPEEVLCGAGEYLGTFSSIEYPNGPAECENGSWQKCESRVLLGSAGQSGSTSQQQISLESVNAVARRELGRAFPEVAFNCSGAGCAKIDVSMDERPYVDIQMRLDVPIGFPLSALLGKHTIEVSSYKREVSELDVAGRPTS